MSMNKEDLLLKYTQRELEMYDEWTKVIQWGRKNPVKFVEEIFGMEFMDYQKYIFMSMWTTPYVCLCQCRNSGKALDLDTPINTPNGLKTMGELKVGDYVYGDDGKPTKIIYESPIFLGHKCYQITFSDNETIVCNAEHLWEVIINDNKEVLNTSTIASIWKPNVIRVRTVDGKFKTMKYLKEVESVPTKCITVDNKSHLYLCGKKNTVTHNSFLYAPYIMARSMLIPNFQSYIISSNGDQAKETFMKIENIAKKQIASLRGLTDVFANELITNNANRDGFKHGASSFEFTLFNGSTCNTLTSNYDGSRGKRSNCNIYDETGFMSQKAFGATEPFTTQDADFSTGGGIDVSLLPKKLQNQIIYASSASAVDTYFYSKYKEYGKQMMMGNKNFFVVDIPCDIPINPFKDGKLYPVGVLSQSKVDKAMREDKATAIREYKNIFDKDGGENQPFKMGTIQRNSKSRKPSLYNEDNGKHHYGLFYDPAHEYDNSIMLIADFYENERYGWMCDIINMVSFADIGKKNKTPMRYPDQLRMIKDLITSYNGKGYADYENIGKILVDSGAGGGGNSICDPLLMPWTDSKGNTIKGLIDRENSEDAWRYPNAVDKLMLVSPKKYKTLMFDALKDMMDKDLITFPNKYEGQGYIRVEAKTGKKVNNGKEDEVELKKVSLDFDEELALRQLDLMKSEICAFWRYDNADHTSHRYGLAKDKENTMHDDRAYVLAMCGWYLSQLRSSEKKKVNPNSGFDPKSMIRFRKPKVK